MDARPVQCRIRRTDLFGKRADKDTLLRHELMFGICLICDDVAAARIDKHEWPIQAQAPRLASVAIGSLLELSKILGSQFGVDTRRLRCRARNEYEHARERQDDRQFAGTMCHFLAVRWLCLRSPNWTSEAPTARQYESQGQATKERRPWTKQLKRS